MYDVYGRVVGAQPLIYVDVVTMADLTSVSHLMTGQYYLGAWSLSWDVEEYEICHIVSFILLLEYNICPLCPGEYTRYHLSQMCDRVTGDRSQHQGQALDQRDESLP